jgi:hypothetical protein
MAPGPVRQRRHWRERHRAIVDQEVIDKMEKLRVRTELAQDKWDAFWDAPLNTSKLEDTRMNAIPPPDGVAGQPGLPRKPE